MMQMRQIGFMAQGMNMFSFSAAPAHQAWYKSMGEIGAGTPQHTRGNWAHQQT
jgi:hypothetical protein